MTEQKTRVDTEAIPTWLTERPQWVVWHLEHPEGATKPTKRPYNPNTGRKASSTDLLTWGTYDEALDAYESGGYEGIGFMFCSADPFVGIDFDDCRDPYSGRVSGKVLRLIERFEDCYVEVSPSGTGMHLITRGTLIVGVNTPAIEVYGQTRFFTVTGEVLPR